MKEKTKNRLFIGGFAIGLNLLVALPFIIARELNITPHVAMSAGFLVTLALFVYISRGWQTGWGSR